MASFLTRLRSCERSATWIYLVVVIALSAVSMFVLYTERGTWTLEQMVDAHIARRDQAWQSRLDEVDRLIITEKFGAAAGRLEAMHRNLPPLRNPRNESGELHYQVLRRLAETYLAQDRRGRAIATFEELMLSNLAPSYTLNAYGRALLAMGREEEGETLLLRASHRYPHHPGAVEGLIQYYGEKGRHRDVLATYAHYADAFSILPAATIESRNASTVLARWQFHPNIDSRRRQYSFPMQRGRTEGVNDSITSLSLRIFATNLCGQVDLNHVTLHPPRIVGAEPPQPLFEIASAEIFSNGVSRVVGKGAARRVDIALPVGSIALDDVDVITVEITAHKPMPESMNHYLARARLAGERRQQVQDGDGLQ